MTTARRRPNGEGSLRQRPDGLWEARVHLDGRRRSFTSKRQAEARRKMREAIADHEAGRTASARTLTVGAYLRDWLAGLPAENLRDRTVGHYATHVRLHIAPRLGRVRLADLRAEHLKRWHAELLAAGLSATTVGRVHSTLRKALNDAERTGLVARAVTRLVRPPKARPARIDPPSTDDVRALLAGAGDDRWAPLYALAATTGMRQGECLALSWQDVDLDGGTIRVRSSLEPRGGGDFARSATKTETSDRDLHLDPGTVAALKRWRLQQAEERLASATWGNSWDLVWTRPDGRPVDGTALVKRLRQTQRRLGLRETRFHDLRHFAATAMLEEGASLDEVRDQLGHSSIVVTASVYAHRSPEGRRRHVEAAASRLYGTQQGQ